MTRIISSFLVTCLLLLLVLLCGTGWAQQCSEQPVEVARLGPVVIGGSVPVAGGAWSDIWDAATQTSAAKSNKTAAAIENWRNIIAAAYITSNATTIRLKFEASTGGMTIENCVIAEQSSGYLYNGSPVSFSFGGSDISEANPIVLGSNEVAYSDSLTFTIDETKTYLIHIWNGSGFANVSGWNGSITHAYWSADAADQSEVSNFGGNDDTAIAGISKVQKYE